MDESTDQSSGYVAKSAGEETLLIGSATAAKSPQSLHQCPRQRGRMKNIHLHTIPPFFTILFILQLRHPCPRQSTHERLAPRYIRPYAPRYAHAAARRGGVTFGKCPKGPPGQRLLARPAPIRTGKPTKMNNTCGSRHFPSGTNDACRRPPSLQ